ncbi:hypothetical protein J2X48_001403 [Bosea sp. BE271]|nr:hypothetical protein [Bosea robiniae]MDR6894629.1 hypothetical protein [Bosea sp. BE109]MDR7137783.1 hypothetical protein [Bosea sp. BE168]MDR7174482.1 hypothetical protein [Bosea sp. BE271]
MAGLVMEIQRSTLRSLALMPVPLEHDDPLSFTLQKSS